MKTDSQRILELELEIERLRTQESGGVWATWSPTPTNLTVGDGTLTCTYLRLGHQVEVDIVFTLGSTSAVGTSPYIPLPVTSVNLGVWKVELKDTGTNNFIGQADAAGANLYVYKTNVVGSSLTYSGVTATTPFTWATGDVIKIHGVYGI